MKKPLMRWLIILLVLVSGSLACNLPAALSSSPPSNAKPDGGNQQSGNQPQVAPGPGQVVVKITQQQLTEFLAAQLAKHPDQPVSDPQVTLTNGQMIVNGKVSQAGFSINAEIVLKPRIDSNGDPRLDVVSMSLGSLPVPDSLKSQVAEMVDTTLQDYLASNENRFKVTGITITEGVMELTGSPK